MSQLCLFLELSSTTTTESKRIRTSLEYLQLELGSVSNLFQLPYDRWQSLGTHCWLKSLWQFTDFAGICLILESPVIPPPPHLQDSAIMACVLLTTLPCKSILAISHCWIAHRAIYWSDIATGWGDGVSPHFLQPPCTPEPSSWLWPPESPSRSDWSIWATFLRNSAYTSNLQFLVHLGPWTSPTH